MKGCQSSCMEPTCMRWWAKMGMQHLEEWWQSVQAAHSSLSNITDCI